MHLRLLFTSLFLILFLSVFSQNDIKVQLTDSETEEPISFATIKFKGTNRGIVADYDGQFRIPYINEADLPDLIITALGYTSIEVSPSQLDVSKIIQLKMEPQTESLDAVILNVTKNDIQKTQNIKKLIEKNKKILGEKIVEKAISLILQNLDNESHSLIGYYRDYQLVSDEYYNLNEGVVEQFDAGISTEKIEDNRNQNAFYSLKTNEKFKQSKRYARKYDGKSKYVENAQLDNFGGNELSILNVHNPIRNYNKNSFSYVYQFNKYFIQNHQFEKKGFSFDKDNPLVNISFATRLNLRKGVQSRVQGTIRPEKFKVIGNISISLKDYAIHGFTYTMYDFNERNPLFNVKIEYQQRNNKMYLNYISFNNRFVVGEDFIFKEESITYDQQNQWFEIKLNNKLALNTRKRPAEYDVQKRNFKIRFNGKKVIVKDVKVFGPKEIRVYIKDYDNSLDQLNDNDMGGLLFEIRGLKDIEGRTIYKHRTLSVYQFREFFTQEILLNKSIDNNLKFANKTQPLIFADINALTNKEPYIVNSPLESRRMNVKEK